MASLSVNANNIAITCGTKAIVMRLETDNSPRVRTVLEPPYIHGQQSEVIDECEKNTATEVPPQRLASPATVILASFSSCDQWLVLCSSNKQLSLWKTSDWSLVSNRVIVRSASSVKFVPSGRFIVVADKSGDAYTYSVENPEEKGSLLLGHLSMLLDILVTPDERYVITCDRDEKVRVSMFPNAYNIHCYCLGHEQFVSHIDLLPHDLSVLLSSSGDGTIIFWDYKSGKHHHTLNCTEQWNNSTGKTSDSTHDSVKICPVKSFTTFKVGEDVSTLCALMSGVNGCLIYTVCHTSALGLQHVECSLSQVLNLHTEPWYISLTNSKHLWVLSPEQTEPLRVYVEEPKSAKFILDQTMLDEYTLAGVSYVNERRDVYASIRPPSPMTVLYKRKYDNVQEYHERKKVRCHLANSKSIDTKLDSDNN